MYYKQIEKIHQVSQNIRREIGDNMSQIAPWFNYGEIEKYYNDLHQTFTTRYDMDTYDYQNPEAIRIREGCSITYDQAFSQINEIRDNLTCISAQLNTILTKHQKNAKVELINNDYFEITTHRYNKFLKPYITKNRNKEISLINGTRIKITDYEEVPLIKKNKIGLRYIFQNEIDLSVCERICMEERAKIKRDIYLFIQSQNNEKVADFVAILDCLCNDIYLIETKGYVMPILDESATKSFVEIEGVSHPIISSLCEYKTNSVIFDEEKKGMLLYGVNESGKSSLMKAIGMNVILAQCGMPVCCQSMRFHPYKKVYTRIQSQDNLWLGQSTFNVEIQELNNIIQGADDKTLILADELCSGTEVTSANKILLSTIIWLSRIGSHYLFTTHLHSLKRSPRLAECEGLHIYDIPIRYDEEKNELVYPRKLVEGNSEELYGVMVARANHLPDDFMDLVDSVSIVEKRQQNAKYNTQKRMDKCEVCGCGADERKLTIDHMLEQQSANENGIIEDTLNKRRIHKNHIDNLVCVCSFCHEKKTKGEISYRYEQTNNGKKLVIDRKTEEAPPESQPRRRLQTNPGITEMLQEFVYSRSQCGEKEIADEFKRTYPVHRKPSVKRIRKIKEQMVLM
jgi:DNA mismatch repair ATPase MutS